MLSFAWCLSFLIGLLSLSEEILWVRVIGFRYESLPPAFSFVLACYLVGIAAGAACGKRLCARSGNLYAAAAVVLCVAALFDVITPLLVGRLIARDNVNLAIPGLAIAVTAALKSTLFPIVHHWGATAEGPHVGRSVSRIYFGNILGATLGPLLTGFVALDYLSVDECFGLAAAVCLLASAACVLWSSRPSLILVTLATAILSSSIAMKVMVPGPGSLGLLANGGVPAMLYFIANRHGVVHGARTSHGDYVYGGNVYDGITTTNVETNPNRLDRLYVLALLHPQPKRVLFVGLSAGAWVRAMEGFPGVERIDVVEINPAYRDVIRSYRQVSALLKDPRVHIQIDDARRWLRRNPDARFDAVVQNTTYHWRANVGNLLSREYFTEVKEHLNPGAVFIANTTGSFDVLATAQAVFAHAYRYTNFVYASDRALAPDIGGLLEVRRPNGTPFAFGQAPASSVEALLANMRLEPVGEFLARHHADAVVVTDDNLVTEYRHGGRFGPKVLQALLPPEAAEFEFGEP
ncbi:MAG: spermidine synthase [Steroidobacterales bacterium]